MCGLVTDLIKEKVTQYKEQILEKQKRKLCVCVCATHGQTRQCVCVCMCVAHVGRIPKGSCLPLEPGRVDSGPKSQKPQHSLTSPSGPMAGVCPSAFSAFWKREIWSDQRRQRRTGQASENNVPAPLPALHLLLLLLFLLFGHLRRLMLPHQLGEVGHILIRLL